MFIWEGILRNQPRVISNNAVNDIYILLRKTTTREPSEPKFIGVTLIENTTPKKHRKRGDYVHEHTCGRLFVDLAVVKNDTNI